MFSSDLPINEIIYSKDLASLTSQKWKRDYVPFQSFEEVEEPEHFSIGTA